MIQRKIGLILALVALLTSTILITETCTRNPPPSLVTASGQVAYQVEDLVAAVGVIQHAAIVANHSGNVSRPLALKVTRATRAIEKTLDGAIDAGKGTAAVYADVGLGLAQLAADPDLKQFQPEISAAQVIVAALGGGK